MNHPFLGAISPDYAAEVLGTGYSRFKSKFGIHGLFKEEPKENRLDLLMVMTDTPSKGQFRAFIHAAMKHYQTICVWSVWSDMLATALQRYGFTPEVEVLGTGESVKGFRWDRTSPANS